MESANLLTMVATLLTLTTLVYLTKHPPAKGEPFSRTQKLMMVPVFLGICLLITAGFLMFARS